MSKLFISHSHSDRTEASSFARLLQDLGYDVWWDFEISGGVEFRNEIDQKLNQSDVVLVLWSPDSVQSNWVIEEAQDGLSRGKLLPITIKDTQPPRGFREIQALDFTAWDGEVDAPELQLLLSTLKDFGGKDPIVESRLSGSYSLKRASLRNVLVAIAAALAFLVYSGWDYLDAGSATQPRARLAICGGLLLLAGIGWLVRSPRGGSIMAAVIAIFSAVAATLLMTTYESPALGLLSPSAPLNICLVLVIVTVYTPIRLPELMAASVVSIGFYTWAAAQFTEGTLVEIGAAVFNLAFVAAALCGLKTTVIKKFGI